MDLTEIGWREGILLAVVLAAVYLGVSLLSLMRLRRSRTRPVPAGEAVAFQGSPTVTAEVAAVAEPVVAEASPPPFAAQLAWAGIEVEVKRLREEVSALRDELAEVRSARRVSPIYADAMALARRGFDARGMAEECGISVAEAELVLAMSREGKDFDSEVDDGGSGYGSGSATEPPER